MAYPVLSTYRLQLRGGTHPFTFADAEKLLDYLHDLGISHLYLSPVLTAVPGSQHGYDVTDPATVSAELGGPDGLAGLAGAARLRDMGLIVDIVPNHVAVDPPQHNAWWWDVLTYGAEHVWLTHQESGHTLVVPRNTDDTWTTLAHILSDCQKYHAIKEPLYV